MDFIILFSIAMSSPYLLASMIRRFINGDNPLLECLTLALYSCILYSIALMAF